MKKVFDTEIISNAEVADEIFKIEVIAPELAEFSKPGQFLTVQLSEEFTLRRPFGIASTKNNRVKFFYRIVGEGTKFLSKKKVGENLNILGPLGKGFDTSVTGKILLVGGGMGLAPLLSVSEYFKNVDVLIGARNKYEAVFWFKEFRPSAEAFFVTTDDGSLGRAGFTTALLPPVLEVEEYAAIFTCGPEVMMRGVAFEAMAREIFCQVSFEKRMACGLGACLSCSIDTINGRKKVCKDGPVFNADEIFEL